MGTLTNSTEPATQTNKATVLYDGACPFCTFSVGILKKLDWFGKLHFQSARDTKTLPVSATPLVPKRLIEEMHLVTPGGQRVHAGFKAFRWMSWRLPATWLIAPWLYIPGIPWLGQKIYLWIAKNRFKLVPCKDGVCAIPPR